MIVEDLTEEHIANFLSQSIRPADEQEWIDGLGKHPKDALRENVAGSHLARALIVPTGEVVLLWGCRVVGEVGYIWLIASDYDPTMAPLIHREFAHEEWPKVIAMAPVLEAWPSSKNTTHHRWLEHFGFVRGVSVIPPGRSVPFVRYFRRSNVL